MKKTIRELQMEQYGREIKWSNIGQNIYEDLADDNFWLYFNIDYKKCQTTDLLSLLQTIRVYQSRTIATEDKDFWFQNLDKFLKISIAIKAELLTRKHIPNKKERDEIRKEKAKNKF